MNLNRAQYILTILEEGSISEAAKKLFISPAALSQAVRLVEEELGLPILERSRGSARLTYAGERYAETVRQMLLLERNLYNEMDEIKREQNGLFRFGIPFLNGQLVLPKIFPVFHAAYPSIRLQITEKGSPDLIQMLLRGELDLALIRTAFCEKGLTYQLLQPERMGILAAKGSGLYDRYPNGTELDIRQAAGEQFIFLKKGHSSRFSQDKLLEAQDLKLSALLELDSFETAKQVTASCGGVMIISYSSFRRDEKIQEHTHFYPLKGTDNEENIYLAYNESTYLTPYMKKWAGLVESVYQEQWSTISSL